MAAIIAKHIETVVANGMTNAQASAIVALVEAQVTEQTNSLKGAITAEIAASEARITAHFNTKIAGVEAKVSDLEVRVSDKVSSLGMKLCLGMAGQSVATILGVLAILKYTGKL